LVRRCITSRDMYLIMLYVHKHSHSQPHSPTLTETHPHIHAHPQISQKATVNYQDIFSTRLPLSPYPVLKSSTPLCFQHMAPSSHTVRIIFASLPLPFTQGIHKRMARFQNLTRNLFLTLHGHNVHHQQQQLSKFLMRYQQFASHA